MAKFEKFYDKSISTLQLEQKKYAKIFLYLHTFCYAVDITLVNNKLSMFVVVGKGKQ